jgi:hypothetical protein
MAAHAKLAHQTWELPNGVLEIWVGSSFSSRPRATVPLSAVIAMIHAIEHEELQSAIKAGKALEDSP